MGLVVFLLLYLLFLRFTAKEAMVVVLTPVLCMLKLPYVMPVAMGLIGTPGFLRIGKLRRCGVLSASDSDHQCTYDQFHGSRGSHCQAAPAD